MATKSFLTSEELESAPTKLQAPAHQPDGEESKLEEFSSREFSSWLGDKLLARLSLHPDWTAAEPIALGSWARGELAPKSDIDLIFAGSDEVVHRVVSDFSKQGLKLRYRVPENREDWTIGVLPFDVLALYQARPLTNVAGEKWQQQIDRLKSRGSSFRRTLIQTMLKERRERGLRYDSIANFLEPNLKYGPGGLRDLEQSLVTSDLFREKFERLDQSDVQHAQQVLNYYKNFFLLVRQKLHLASGGGEVLAAPEQRPISDWLGFHSHQDFMREIQKGLSRVSFYADWMIKVATCSRARVEAANQIPLKKPLQFFTALEKDPSILTQFRVRLKSDTVFEAFSGLKAIAKPSVESVAFGKKLNQFLMPEGDESKLVALFRSRLIDHIVPEFRKIVGHVQHDQYHRFSVDAHILQALRELRRLKQNPKLAGQLSAHFKKLKKQEWLILAYACLYHDIAKGREGHHAEVGSQIALSDLKRFGMTREQITEITWVVEEHLILSTAAFRENSRSPVTWQKLLDHGVKGRRLSLLLAFTVVDIRATNPDAWTPWKERLMNELVSQIERPETTSFLKFKKRLERSKSAEVRAFGESWPQALDPFLIHTVPIRVLTEDLNRLIASVKDRRTLSPLVIALEGGQTWVRFHSSEDRSGLFLSYVAALSGFGLSIRHASVTTVPEFGVYDWFEVKTSKDAGLIERWLGKLLRDGSKNEPVSSSLKNEGKASAAKFDSVDFVSTSDEEWVISFRGRDQSGALKAAVGSLFRQGLEIRWATVHTWGRQIDDVFGVRPPQRDGVRSRQRDGVRLQQQEVLLKIRAEMT